MHLHLEQQEEAAEPLSAAFVVVIEDSKSVESHHGCSRWTVHPPCTGFAETEASEAPAEGCSMHNRGTMACKSVSSATPVKLRPCCRERLGAFCGLTSQSQPTPRAEDRLQHPFNMHRQVTFMTTPSCCMCLSAHLSLPL